jgi:flagellar motor switch protein FliN
MSNLANAKNLDVVMDVRVQLTVQLGSCRLPMREIINLAPGSVIQLKESAKDPVGLYANGKIVAYGEVVVVDDSFGVKVTELIEGPDHADS